MNPFSSHQARPDGRHGRDTVRRVTAVAAVFVMVIAAPLVVRALADDSGEDIPSTQEAVEMSGQWSFEPRRGDALDDPTASGSDDLDATARQAVEQADDDVTSEAEATAFDTARDSAREPDRVAAQPLDVLAFLTTPYTWDERTLRGGSAPEGTQRGR